MSSIKLRFNDILADPKRRFVEKLDDGQKGLFLMLLMLMGYYQNQVPTDATSLKRVLNLQDTPEKIATDVNHICEVYMTSLKKGDFIMFNNFKLTNKPPKGLRVKSPSSPALDLVKLFRTKHKEILDIGYIPNWARDTVIIKAMLESFSRPELEMVMDEFLRAALEEDTWWADKVSIPTLKSCAHHVIGRLRGSKGGKKR